MKAWQIDRLGGELSFKDVPMPEVRSGSVLVRIEASTLPSYLEAYMRVNCLRTDTGRRRGCSRRAAMGSG